MTASTMNSSAYSGGLVGRNVPYSGEITITNCYAAGNVTVSSFDSGAYGGGLIGDIDTNSGTVVVASCYATGSVAATSTGGFTYAGSLVGNNHNGTVTNCYRYEKQVIKSVNNDVESGASNELGTSCKVDQLNSAEFYTDTLGWDAEIWDFSNLDFGNGKYPVLKTTN